MSFVQFPSGNIDLFAGIIQNVAKEAKVLFDRGQDIPDFATFLLDGQGPEPHLQAVQKSCRRGESAKNYRVFPHDELKESGNPEHLGIEAFKRQKQDGKICGDGEIQVFVPDVACAALDAVHDRLLRAENSCKIMPREGSHHRQEPSEDVLNLDFWIEREFGGQSVHFFFDFA